MPRKQMNGTESKVLCNIFSKCTINTFQHLTKVKYLFWRCFMWTKHFHLSLNFSFQFVKRMRSHFNQKFSFPFHTMNRFWQFHRSRRILNINIFSELKLTGWSKVKTIAVATFTDITIWTFEAVDTVYPALPRGHAVHTVRRAQTRASCLLVTCGAQQLVGADSARDIGAGVSLHVLCWHWLSHPLTIGWGWQCCCWECCCGCVGCCWDTIVLVRRSWDHRNRSTSAIVAPRYNIALEQKEENGKLIQTLKLSYWAAFNGIEFYRRASREYEFYLFHLMLWSSNCACWQWCYRWSCSVRN